MSVRRGRTARPPRPRSHLAPAHPLCDHDVRRPSQGTLTSLRRIPGHEEQPGVITASRQRSRATWSGIDAAAEPARPMAGGEDGGQDPPPRTAPVRGRAAVRR